MDIEKTLKILSSTAFDQFIGKIEDLRFECKGAPYHLPDIKNKQELAKDVCGFANSGVGKCFDIEVFQQHVFTIRP